MGLQLDLPKLYLECGHCAEPGLRAAYVASQPSYGKASRDPEAHHGQPVERIAAE